jgi:Arc/MetJ-type ribon-helix-helix transcriptional regulator
MKVIWSLFWVNLVAVLLVVAQGQQDEWLIATGSGKNRSEAIRDALRSVVEQGVGVWVQARSLMVNLEVKEDVVRTVAKGYVRHYEILEEQQEGEIYRVRLRARVADIFQAIDQHFSQAPALYQELGEPRFLVLLNEEALGRPLQDEHPAELAIIDILRKEGIRVVDRSQAEKVRSAGRLQALLSGQKEVAWVVGEESRAEILLVGTAKAEFFGEVISGVSTCHAHIELKAIWVDDGEVLVARRLEKVAAAEFQLSTAARIALQKAGQRILQDGFLALIVKAFALEAAEGRTIALRLKGNYDDLLRLASIVEKYQDFVSVVRDEYAEGKKEGCLWVRVKGDLSVFLRWLLNQPWKHSRLKVLRKSASGREVMLGAL